MPHSYVIISRVEPPAPSRLYIVNPYIRRARCSGVHHQSVIQHPATMKFQVFFLFVLSVGTLADQQPGYGDGYQQDGYDLASLFPSLHPFNHNFSFDV